MKLLAAGAALLAMACEELDRRPDLGEVHYVRLDSSFTQDEREALSECSASWRTFSHERVDIVFGDRGDINLERRGPTPGGFDRVERRAWIDADALYSDGFDSRTGVQAMCMNLIGQLFLIPLHDRQGALSREDVVPFFTSADRVACNDAGIC